LSPASEFIDFIIGLEANSNKNEWELKGLPKEVTKAFIKDPEKFIIER